MKLKALTGFAGVEGSAGQGEVFEVDDEKAARMLKQRYPVEEVKEDEGKPTETPGGEADNPKPPKAGK